MRRVPVFQNAGSAKEKKNHSPRTVLLWSLPGVLRIKPLILPLVLMLGFLLQFTCCLC